MRIRRVAILGLGLIGSSLARALAEKSPGWHIGAYDTSRDALDFASGEGFVHAAFATPEEAAVGADIVVMATPTAAFGGLAQSIGAALAPGTLLLDTGSVKRQAIASILPQLPEYCRYVPCHPIAGSEHSGVRAGRADLFRNRLVILTPDEGSLRDPSLMTAKAFWEETGARTEFMPPELHDRIYAYVSHLPQILAFAARVPWQDLDVGQRSGETWRAQRLLASNSELWAEICLANWDYISEALNDYIAFAGQMEGELAEARPDSLSNQDVADDAGLFAALLATCLVATVAQLQESLGVHPAHYAGAGFADMAHAAGAEPEQMLATISGRHAVLAPKMAMFLTNLGNIRSALERHDVQTLLRAFQP